MMRVTILIAVTLIVMATLTVGRTLGRLWARLTRTLLRDAGLVSDAEVDELVEFAPVQPDAPATGADVYRDAGTLDFFHSVITYWALHQV